MDKILFGTGIILIKQRRDSRGRLIPKEKRRNLAMNIVKSFTFENSVDQKSLFGSNSYAEAVANGQQSASGAVDFASLNLDLQALFLGQSVTAGNRGAQWKYDTFIVPEGGELTIDVEDDGIFEEDINVLMKGDINTQSKEFVRVETAPAPGQYKVTSAGVYTFNVADEGKELFINYFYNSPLGKSVRVANVSMGAGAECEVAILFPGYGFMIKLNNVTFGGANMNFTSDDFGAYTVNYSCAKDENGDVYSLNKDVEDFE